jgi:acetyltransferase-like isoleucine patch superfamily enzyme
MLYKGKFWGMENKFKKKILRFCAKILNFFLLYKIKSYGKRVYIDFPCRLRGKNNISIGDDVSIAAFVHMWGQGGITIGNRVMIGSHSAITSLTHNQEAVNMYISRVSKSVIIKDDVWIGAHVVIMPGIIIGEGAIIGAGSVVTTDIPPKGIAMGVPAKVVRSRNQKTTVS